MVEEIFKCSKCNHRVKRGANFCANCGEKLDWGINLKGSSKKKLNRGSTALSKRSEYECKGGEHGLLCDKLNNEVDTTKTDEYNIFGSPVSSKCPECGCKGGNHIPLCSRYGKKTETSKTDGYDIFESPASNKCPEYGCRGGKHIPLCSRYNKEASAENKGTHSKKDKIDVDPKAVSVLYKDSLSLGICILLFCGFGIIFGTIILIKRASLRKWIDHLRNPKYYPGIPTEDMLRDVRAIDTCCVWVITVSGTLGVAGMWSMMHSSSYSSINNSSITVIGAQTALHIIGTILAILLVRKTNAVTESSKSGMTYSSKL